MAKPKTVQKPVRIFPPSPELEWLREMVIDADGVFTDQLDLDMLQQVYQFLLWLGRMRKAKEGSREYLVAYGMALRYREAVYREQLTEAEYKSVQAAEIGYVELKKEKK